MPRSTWLCLAGLLAACDGGEPALPPPHDVQASWRVRCEAPDEACDYPVRTVAGSIGPDDPDGFHVGCEAADGALDVTVGKYTTVTPSGTFPGFALIFDVGYDPAVGFDVSRCAVLLGEADERQWGGSCTAGFPCLLDAPTLVDGSFSATLRCVDVPSIPFQAGREAQLASGTDDNAPVALQISGCTIE